MTLICTIEFWIILTTLSGRSFSTVVSFYNSYGWSICLINQFLVLRNCLAFASRNYFSREFYLQLTQISTVPPAYHFGAAETVSKVSHKYNLLLMLSPCKYCWQPAGEVASRFCPLCFSNLPIQGPPN